VKRVLFNERSGKPIKRYAVGSSLKCGPAEKSQALGQKNSGSIFPNGVRFLANGGSICQRAMYMTIWIRIFGLYARA
jgi:hypothetical protein